MIDEDHPWLKKQRGLRYVGGRPPKGFKNKFRVAARFAMELERAGRRVTHADIREMLNYLKRGYKTDAQSISRLLYSTRESNPHRRRYPNGHRVEVQRDTTKATYWSLNEAAKKNGCSPESVRKWASSEKPNRKGQIWRYID